MQVLKLPLLDITVHLNYRLFKDTTVSVLGLPRNVPRV